MPHVITQACCNDASCTEVCPVDCIHPGPAEPGFDAAQMLYIDPTVCIDCGVCVAECPVGAIYPAERLPPELAEYAAINADFPVPKTARRPESATLGGPPAQLQSRALRVAIVGSGPAGCYAAIELLDRGGPRLEVDIFERLPTPWGLVRAGVAPDHLHTKEVAQLFAERLQDPRLRFILNVEVGVHVSPEELAGSYDAVIYATGALASRGLGVAGEHVPGSHAAADFVAWYNGHPDFADRRFSLSGRRAVIVGNGNVALDVARLLVAEPGQLRRSDMAQHAVAALADSRIDEVVIVGRRSVVHAACTAPELMALRHLPGVAVRVSPSDLELTEAEQALADSSFEGRLKLQLFREFSAAGADTTAARTIRFRFLESPVSLTGVDAVDGVMLQRNRAVQGPDGTERLESTDRIVRLEAGLVLRSVGFLGRPLAGVPFDEGRSVIPNRDGRVLGATAGAVRPGLYTVGWIKRGPSGVIGTNKYCARDTVLALLADAERGSLPSPRTGKSEFDAMLAQRQPERLDWRHWRRIDDREQAVGEAAGRPRTKLVARVDLLQAALG